MTQRFDPFGLTNPYVRKARLEPALIVTLPLAVAGIALFPGSLFSLKPVWSIIVLFGGMALLSQVARDRGKALEPKLFASWGGKPTVCSLRHRDAPNKAILARRHRQLAGLLGHIAIPNADEETRDPRAADDAYEACGTYLREITRDRKRFPLVFEENCNYGFRRNLWGMKPLGIILSFVSATATLVPALLDAIHGVRPAPVLGVCGGIDVLFLIAWLTWFTPNWVRTTADAYAERLLESCESLGGNVVASAAQSNP